MKFQLSTWTNQDHWKERIITFDPSWFTACMGTGIIVQLLTNFPYPAQWLRNLAYCFWILDIFMFTLFLVLSSLRVVLYPKVASNVLADFSQVSYLGAIPIAFDTVIVGLPIFYAHQSAAIYAAEVLFWISVLLTLLVTCGAIFVMYNNEGRHKLSEVNGAWLLTFIPMIVIAATGATLSPQLNGANRIAMLMISFLMWSLGLGMSYLILAIYFWRLMSCQLPARDAIVSTFVPVGPLGMGAYAIQNLAVALATYIKDSQYILERPPQPPTDPIAFGAIAETVHWLGIIIAIALLGLGTFFLIEAFASVWVRVPKTFNVGFWSFVFPCGVYSNAWCQMSTDLRNEGMKGWAATCVMATLLLWLGCALTTFWKGVLQGQLFFGPGLQGWLEHEEIDHLQHDLGPNGMKNHPADSHARATGRSKNNSVFHRASKRDGTYSLGQKGVGP